MKAEAPAMKAEALLRLIPILRLILILRWLILILRWLILILRWLILIQALRNSHFTNLDTSRLKRRDSYDRFHAFLILPSVYKVIS